MCGGCIGCVVGVSCRKSSPAELVPPGLKRQRCASRIRSALPNYFPLFPGCVVGVLGVWWVYWVCGECIGCVVGVLGVW